MTINEHQELEILEIIIEENITVLKDSDIPQRLVEKLGNGSSEIFRAMARDGFLQSATGFGMPYLVTPLAYNRYRLLKQKLESEQSGNKMNVWILFFGIVAALAGIVGAYYAAKAYYATINPPKPPEVIQHPITKDSPAIK